MRHLSLPRLRQGLLDLHGSGVLQGDPPVHRCTGLNKYICVHTRDGLAFPLWEGTISSTQGEFRGVWALWVRCREGSLASDEGWTGGCLKLQAGNSLAVQWLGLQASTPWGAGSIPSCGTKIPHAVRCGLNKQTNKNKNKKKKYLLKKKKLQASASATRAALHLCLLSPLPLCSGWSLTLALC